MDELDNSVLDAYISDEDPDFVPTTAEIAQAEADEEKASLEVEESITADKILEELNRDLVVAEELSEAKLAEYLSEDDPDYQEVDETENSDDAEEKENSGELRLFRYFSATIRQSEHVRTLFDCGLLPSKRISGILNVLNGMK